QPLPGQPGRPRQQPAPDLGRHHPAAPGPGIARARRRAAGAAAAAARSNPPVADAGPGLGAGVLPPDRGRPGLPGRRPARDRRGLPRCPPSRGRSPPAPGRRAPGGHAQPRPGAAHRRAVSLVQAVSIARRGMRALGGLLVVAALGLAPAARAEAPLTVFAAASLKESLDEAARTFEAATGQPVRVSYAASSALA